jgi:hypothetical protein
MQLVVFQEQQTLTQMEHLIWCRQEIAMPLF